ncbi:MAG: pilin [Patescibacteria group bacterium]|nr:pilin [Patescibacteria group bacterium]
MDYQLLAPLPFIKDNIVTDLSTYLSAIFKISIGIAIAFAILMIVWGGLEYMLSGIPAMKLDGKKRIWDAILGLLLTLSAWLLLYTINPKLVDFSNLEIDKLTIKIDPPSEAINLQKALNDQIKIERLNAENLERQALLEKDPEIKAILEKQAQATRDLGINIGKIGNNKIAAIEAIKNKDYSKATTLKIQISIESRTAADKLMLEGFTKEADQIRTEARQAGIDIDQSIQNRQQLETEKTQSSLDSSFH